MHDLRPGPNVKVGASEVIASGTRGSFTSRRAAPNRGGLERLFEGHMLLVVGDNPHSSITVLVFFSCLTI